MTRKDYELVTGAIRRAPMEQNVRYKLVQEFGDTLGRTYSNFDRGLFYAACMPLHYKEN